MGFWGFGVLGFWLTQKLSASNYFCCILVRSVVIYHLAAFAASVELGHSLALFPLRLLLYILLGEYRQHSLFVARALALFVLLVSLLVDGFLAVHPRWATYFKFDSVGVFS